MFTLIAYKSSGSTSCRGCIMDKWDSDIEMRCFIDKNKAIEWASDFYYKNYIDLGSHEISYFINGIPFDTDMLREEWPDEYYEMIDEHKHMDSDAEKIASQKYQEYKAKKELQKIQQENKERELKVQKDLELLAKLKKQYGE